MNEFELLFEMLKDLNRRVSVMETSPKSPTTATRLKPDDQKFNELSTRLANILRGGKTE